jgi:uncharacterized protein YqeY
LTLSRGSSYRCDDAPARETEAHVSALLERLSTDCKTALKARDEFRVGVLRMLLARVKDLQIEQGRNEPLGEDQVIQTLASYAKQRAEAAETFAQAGRPDLRDKEMRERDIVLAYLPRQLDDDGIRAVLREVIAQAGAGSNRDLGKVMGPAMARLKGQADGGRVQQLARELLGG